MPNFPAVYWKYSNDKLKTRDKVNDLLKEDGSLTKNDNEKAEVLNSFFKSVFTVEDTSQLPEPQGMKVDQVLSTVEITPLITGAWCCIIGVQRVKFNE